MNNEMLQLSEESPSPTSHMDAALPHSPKNFDFRQLTSDAQVLRQVLGFPEQLRLMRRAMFYTTATVLASSNCFGFKLSNRFELDGKKMLRRSG